ncbi:MAG TPA: hypothetical protein VNS09_11155 [Solirubrobacter sp.]|nr:hypothetical protein [Solirubrobacter sp.]
MLAGRAALLDAHRETTDRRAEAAGDRLVVLAQLTVHDDERRTLRAVLRALRTVRRGALVVFPARVLRGAPAERAAVAELVRERSLAVVIGVAPSALWCVDAHVRRDVPVGAGTDAGGRVVTLASLRVGLLCGAELRRPALVHGVVERGCDVLVTCAADEPRVAAAQRALVLARALDCRVPHAYVNAVGRRDGVRFAGGSRLVRPGDEALPGWRAARAPLISGRWLSPSTQEQIA